MIRITNDAVSQVICDLYFLLYTPPSICIYCFIRPLNYWNVFLLYAVLDLIDFLHASLPRDISETYFPLVTCMIRDSRWGTADYLCLSLADNHQSHETCMSRVEIITDVENPRSRCIPQQSTTPTVCTSIPFWINVLSHQHQQFSFSQIRFEESFECNTWGAEGSIIASYRSLTNSF